MGVFTKKETKEEKKQRKLQEILEKYGLQDLQDPRDLDQVKNIAANLAGNDLFLVGTALANSQDMGKITLLRALVEQNFIIIRQLDKITNK